MSLLYRNIPIRAKAFAAALVFLISLVGLGLSAHHTMLVSVVGLEELSSTSLPKQKAASDLKDEVVATHVNLARYVALASAGAERERLSGLAEEILYSLDSMARRLRMFTTRWNLADDARTNAVNVHIKWRNYEDVARTTLDVARVNPTTAAAVLQLAETEYLNVAMTLEAFTDAVARETATKADNLLERAIVDQKVLGIVGGLGVLFSVLVTVFAVRSIVQPIRSVTEMMEAVSSGNLDVDTDLRDRGDEIGQMVKAIGTFRETIVQDNKLLNDREAELRLQNTRFNAALSNMGHGLSMFDADGCLVVCNDRYREIYCLTQEDTRIGASLRDIVAAKQREGVFDGDCEEYCAAIIARAETGQSGHEFQHLENGRTISITSQPIVTGGWVATHEDITELRQAEAEAKKSHALLMDVIEAMPAGLVFYDVDDRLILWNRRYHETFAKTADLRIKGKRFEEILRAAVERGVFSDAEDNTEEWIAERLAWRSLEQSVHEHCLDNGHWMRIEDCRTADGGHIGVVVDITELKQREEELRVQNVRFDAALRNMSQGLAMFDSEARLVLYNQRYLEMYGLSPDVIKPGCHLRDLIACRVETGLFVGDPDKYCDKILAAVAEGSESRLLVELSDGRFIAAKDQPMAGGGWVSTHEDITERQQAEQRISYLAHHDDLTGLNSRATFLEKIDAAMSAANGAGEDFAVFVVDLDQFKAVNDSFGHPAGDALLKQVSQRLRSCVRETDVIARLGGDEFAILQASIGANARSAAIRLASRVLERVSAPYDIGGNRMNIGASIGIAFFSQDAGDADQILKNADLALYKMKSEGRNGFRIFEAEMAAEMRSRHALGMDLRGAISRNEFELNYQTIVDARTEEICGIEALLRWNHPRLGLISPDRFIPLAEETGVIVRLGEWTINRACTDAAAWPEHLKIAVNLSPAQFVRGDLFEVITRALAMSNLSPKRLEVEITESVLLQDNAEFLAVLHRLKELGVSVVLDDFGTGYSSLSYLRMFPYDKIKIDRSFVSELSSREDCAAIVAAVTGLGRNLGVTTTAEGVETREQFELLRAAGCTQMQGYLFSRPRPLRELDLRGDIASRAGAGVA